MDRIPTRHRGHAPPLRCARAVAHPPSRARPRRGGLGRRQPRRARRAGSPPEGPTPRRGDLWTTNAGVRVLVVSSTVYNEIPSEPTVIIVPVFDSEPDAGFGV